MIFEQDLPDAFEMAVFLRITLVCIIGCFFFRRNGTSTEVKGFVEKCNSRESRNDRDSSGVTNVLTPL